MIYASAVAVVSSSALEGEASLPPHSAYFHNIPFLFIKKIKEIKKIKVF